MFQTVPDPESYFVTRWGQDQFAGMSYSYIPVGCSGQLYDELARDIDEKVYFAGEVRFDTL